MSIINSDINGGEGIAVEKVTVLFFFTFAQSSGVTCLATKEWVDLISGKSDIAASFGLQQFKIELGKKLWMLDFSRVLIGCGC